MNDKIRTLTCWLLVMIAIWLPRAFRLDQYVTVDEVKWLVRSANFYQALSTGEYQYTFQHGHPGVTVMWIGAAAFARHFPNYLEVTPGQFAQPNESFDRFLSEQGHSALEMLAAGRTLVVAINVLLLGIAFLYVTRMVGLLAALVGMALIAFDPYSTAFTRFLHPDGLLSSFMLVASLAYLVYLWRGRRVLDLVASAVFAGLACLTKTPGIFLFPLVGLFALVETIAYLGGERTARTRFSLRTLGRLAVPVLVWLVVALSVIFLLWPVLWVAPRETLLRVFDISRGYLKEGHSGPVFFHGEILMGDAGFAFYPLTYLWRTTPITLVGLLLALALSTRTHALTKLHTETHQFILGMAFLAVFFWIFMSFGAKKFDRYLMPVFMPLDLEAGVGWAIGVGLLLPWLGKQIRPRIRQMAASGLLAGVVAGQAAQCLATFPYYLSYYNPIMGGSARAPEQMMIGWGEGLDEAARFLNQHIDTSTARVASWYSWGPFSYFYNGNAESNRSYWDADYAVVYRHQWQRGLPSRRLLEYFDGLTPMHTVVINDIEYARVYNLREAPRAAYMANFGNAIRLVYYESYSGVLHRGQKFESAIFFLKTAPLDVDWYLRARIVNETGDELLVLDGHPAGRATSQWNVGELLLDNRYRVSIEDSTPPGRYSLEFSFYDPATGEELPVTSAITGEPLPQPYVLDYLLVDNQP